ncbi:MAG: CPBP family intramembrane glutamic endopeptidase [Candidatus Thermoplasmatota archaeon]
MAVETLPFDPASGTMRPVAPPAAAPDAARRNPVATVAHILLGLDLALLAYSGLDALVRAVQDAASGVAPSSDPIPASFLYANSLLTFVLMAVIPILWLLATRERPVAGTIAYLQLHTPLLSLAKGVGLGLLCLVVLVTLALGLQRVGIGEENPVADGLLANMTLPLALTLSLSAGIGEEVLFRGILQRWVGVWGQAALFGLSHAGYGTVLQLLIPAALGLLFGLIVKRRGSLWIVIAAHVTFNLVQLALPVLVDSP